MNGFLLQDYVFRMSERMQRPLIVPVVDVVSFTPLTNFFHTVYYHLDTGGQNTYFVNTCDIFIGEILISPSVVGLAVIPNLLGIPLDIEGNEQYSNGSFHLEMVDTGFKGAGAIAGWQVATVFAGAGYTIRYEGYLLKKI